MKWGRKHILICLPVWVPFTSSASGYYRRLMQVRFDHEAYHDRCQAETVMSMIAFHTNGRNYHSQCRDLYLIALTHNAMILLSVQFFKRADLSRLFPP